MRVELLLAVRAAARTGVAECAGRLSPALWPCHPPALTPLPNLCSYCFEIEPSGGRGTAVTWQLKCRSAPPHRGTVGLKAVPSPVNTWEAGVARAGAARAGAARATRHRSAIRALIWLAKARGRGGEAGER